MGLRDPFGTAGTWPPHPLSSPPNTQILGAQTSWLSASFGPGPLLGTCQALARHLSELPQGPVLGRGDRT